MTAPHIPLFPVCILGGVLAGGLYAISAARKSGFAAFVCFEAVTLGAALAATLHLIYGVVFPEHLVEIVATSDGRMLHPPEIEVKMDNLHRLDIFIGCGFLILLELRGLRNILEHPSHI